MPLLLKTDKWNKCNHWIKQENGKWATVPQIYVKTTSSSNKWKPLYKYSWEIGEWGECSKTCNTGTQTRPVKCKREDGKYFDDSFCISQVGEKPKDTQECNSHSCNYWYKGHYDDCAAFYTWNGSSWRHVWSSCATADWVEIPMSSPDFGDIIPTPIQWTVWDTNGTSYHGGLYICNTQNNCSSAIVEFPKQGACGGGTFYFTWNARDNSFTRVRCTGNNGGCSGCSPCTDSGWGYLNCTGNYPDWAGG